MLVMLCLSQCALMITDWIFNCYIEFLQWKGKSMPFSCFDPIIEKKQRTD